MTEHSSRAHKVERPPASHGPRASSRGGTITRLIRFALPAFLLLLGVGIGIVGWWLSPSRSPVYSPASFTVDANSYDGADVSSVQVTLSPDLRSAVLNYSLAISIEASTAQTSPQNSPFVQMLVFLPNGATPFDCTNSSCLGRYAASILALSYVGSKNGVTFWTGTLSLKVRGARLGFDENGVDLDAHLPSINLDPAQTSDAAMTYVTYYVPSANSYDWGASTQPWLLSSNFVEWQESAQESSSAALLSAINPSQESTDSNRTFLAGVLFGVAGAALIGFLTELFHELLQMHSGERSQPRARTGHHLSERSGGRKD